MHENIGVVTVECILTKEEVVRIKNLQTLPNFPPLIEHDDGSKTITFERDALSLKMLSLLEVQLLLRNSEITANG